MSATIIIFYFVICSNFYPVKSETDTVRLGFIGPKLIADGSPNHPGNHAIAAFKMAVNEINNKNDGVEDDLLPGIDIKVALRSPRANLVVGMKDALELSQSVFNGSGVHGVIGAASTPSSQAASLVFSNSRYRIPQLSYGATDSELGHKSEYPNLLRTCPTDAFEARVIANVIHQAFGWQRVTVIYSGDRFGSDSYLEFESEASNLEIDIESKFTFWSGIDDFSSVIESIQNGVGMLRIFVLLMKSVDAGLLLEQGYNKGLFIEGTQILGTQYITLPEVWKQMSDPSKIPKIMKGVMGVRPASDEMRISSEYEEFVQRFREQKNTIYRDNHGVLHCDESKDDDGDSYLYQEQLNPDDPDSPFICTGVNFTSFATNGADIHEWALYSYDATFALAKGLHAFLSENNLMNITGDAIQEILINNISFPGVTGEISFSQGIIGVDAYGRGDRKTPAGYEVVLFHPEFFDPEDPYSSDVIRVVGDWSSAEAAFILCPPALEEDCSAWIFNTEDEMPPNDEPEVIEVQMSPSTRLGLRLGGAVALLLVVFFGTVMWICRTTRLIKAAVPQMMFVVVLGGMIGCLRVFLATLDLTNDLCIGGKWIGHLSFGMVFGALVIKTWRVYVITSSGFRRVRVSMTQMKLTLLGALCLFCLYLMIDTLVGKPHLDFERERLGRYEYHYMKCENVNESVTNVLFAIEGLMLFLGAKFCWSTKDAPGAVNDSRYIALSMFIIVFVCAVSFPIVFIKIEQLPSILMTVNAAGLLTSTLGCLVIVFVPKFQLLLEGADVDDTFTIIRPGDGDLGTSNPIKALKDRVVAHSSSSGVVSILSNTITRRYKQSLQSTDVLHSMAREKQNQRKGSPVINNQVHLRGAGQSKDDLGNAGYNNSHNLEELRQRGMNGDSPELNVELSHHRKESRKRSPNMEIGPAQIDKKDPILRGTSMRRSIHEFISTSLKATRASSLKARGQSYMKMLGASYDDDDDLIMQQIIDEHQQRQSAHHLSFKKLGDVGSDDSDDGHDLAVHEGVFVKTQRKQLDMHHHQDDHDDDDGRHDPEDRTRVEKDMDVTSYRFPMIASLLSLSTSKSRQSVPQLERDHSKVSSSDTGAKSPIIARGSSRLLLSQDDGTNTTQSGKYKRVTPMQFERDSKIRYSSRHLTDIDVDKSTGSAQETVDKKRQLVLDGDIGLRDGVGDELGLKIAAQQNIPTLIPIEEPVSDVDDNSQHHKKPLLADSPVKDVGDKDDMMKIKKASDPSSSSSNFFVGYIFENEKDPRNKSSSLNKSSAKSSGTMTASTITLATAGTRVINSSAELRIARDQRNDENDDEKNDYVM